MVRKFLASTLVLSVLFACLIGATGHVRAQTASTPAETANTERSPREDTPTKSFFESPLGVQIAWYASIAGVVLGLIPLGLYFQERNKSKLLNSVLERYDLAKRIEADARTATSDKATTEEALQRSRQELTELTRQVEDSIPNQARAAFFRAAIPEIDRQMLYLQEQRKAMEAGLMETGVPVDESSRLRPILEAEINQTVMARRRLDEKQTALSIFAGLAAGSGVFGLIPLLVFPIQLVLGIAILWAVYDLYLQWSVVYPDHRVVRFVRAAGWRLPAGVVAFFILFITLFILLILYLD